MLPEGKQKAEVFYDFMDHTIKHVCTELGLTVHAVRYYCDMGLVPGLRHDKNGNRIFDETSINWLRAVTFLRAGGMSIAQIQHYFALCQQGVSTLAERKAILEQARDAAQKDLEEAAIRLHCLNEKINICQQAIEGRCADDCNPLNW